MKKTTAKKAVATRRQKVISITPDLLARLDQYGDVNWSAVACQAFEIKLGELSAQKEKKTMNDVIAQLRASKLRSQEEGFKEGFEAGELFVTNNDHLEYDQLRRLASLKSDLERNHCWDGWFDNEDAYTAAERLHAVMVGMVGEDRNAACEFFEIHGIESDDQDNPQFIHGFAEGVLSIWSQVEDKI